MSKTEIYLIRHGQSEGNLHSLFLGHTDMDITALGHEQAERTARYLENIHADVIYSSDLLRAYHTACHTAALKGMEVIKRSDLREIFAGKWEGMSFADIAKEYKEDFALWRENVGFARCTDGESVIELQKRFTEAVERIVKENDGKTVFIFSHATTVRTASAKWMGISPERLGELPWPTNASVTHARYENGEFSVLEYSKDSFLADISTM